jgi:hypothetical protein
MKDARTCLLAGVMSVAATAVLAQDIAPPARGTRLRLTLATEDRPLVGAFIALDAGTLTLLLAGRTDAMAVRRESIRRVEVSEGYRSRGKGALYGAIIGAGAGAVIGVAGGVANNPPSNRVLGASVGGIFLAFLGAPVGGLVGMAVPPAERWKDLPMDRLRVSLAPVRGRGAAISVAFVF